MAIPLAEAIVLGAVQGVTEFLPISSDGHLSLAQLYFGREPELALTVLLHAGTLAATLIVLWERVKSATFDGARALFRPSLFRDTPGGRDALFVILASIPTAIIGFTLKKPVEVWSSSPVIIGICLLGSALAVGSTRFAPRGEKDVPGAMAAIVVGIAQGSAVLPGLSRSAMTIASLLWLGVRAPRAFELSFLLSLPAVAGALALEARHAFHGGAAEVVPLVAGTVVSLACGIGALMALRGVLARGKLAWFAVYLVPLAVATIFWGYAKP
jgi:undecaprenyl-diphosphatase